MTFYPYFTPIDVFRSIGYHARQLLHFGPFNQVKKLFRRIKRFRRIFTRYDKLDVIFLTFVYFALVVDALM